MNRTLTNRTYPTSLEQKDIFSKEDPESEIVSNDGIDAAAS